MMTGVRAVIRRGYTGADHLIDQTAETAANDAVAGVKFRRASGALCAAEAAFLATCDRRVRTARIVVTLRGGHGDLIELG